MSQIYQNQVQLVELPEIKLVGFAVTSPFKGHRSERVDEMKREFFERKGEIRQLLRPERFVSPSFASEVLFTYMICMEVDNIYEVPEGMIGFTVPPHRYAKVRSDGDPYRVIHDYLAEHRLQNDRRALALEVYPFENPVWPDRADVYIPLVTQP